MERKGAAFNTGNKVGTSLHCIISFTKIPRHSNKEVSMINN
jgi:hypothetical protein